MSHVLKNKQRLLRFGLVGGGNTVLDFGLLFILKSAGLPVIPANIISSTAAFVLSFVLNKNYTFNAKTGTLLKQMILFAIVTLFGLWVLQSLVISLTLPIAIQLSNDQSIALFVAKLAATGVSLVWNYILYSLVVFNKKSLGQD